MRGVLAVMAASTLTAAPAAQLKADPSPAPITLTSVSEGEAAVRTRHESRIAGRRFTYTAEIGRLAIRASLTGEAQGYIGYVAYRVPSAGRPRPVTFVWNGGPGANSSLLHFSTAGPKLAQGDRLIDNADSWLDATDLVMVDPVGTGFARPAKAEYADLFYGTRGDVASVAEFVRVWLLQQGAEAVPVFLAGESWGAGRAASVAHVLQSRGQSIAGLVLISGGWALNTDYVLPNLRRALGIVDMAAVAHFHGLLSPELGETLVEVRRAAEEWARAVYAPALARLDTLDDEERERIAQMLARFSGLPVERIDRQRLEISPRQFRTQILASRGQEAYVFDLRRTSPHGEPARAAILHYLRNDLGFRSGLPYVGLEPLEHGFVADGKAPQSVGARWDYATADVSPEQRRTAIAAAIASGSGPPQLGPPLPATLEALAQNPAMRVLVAGGLYDSFRPCAIGEETARRLPSTVSPSIRFKCYSGGHAMYKDASTRTEFARDLRRFFRGLWP
jgi:carboxypeptidase C (cathepsin A)